MLVNGTPPSAITKNITPEAALSTPEFIVHDLPSKGYIRRCHTILRIVGETLTSYWLAKQEKWKQLFTDRTSRRQVALQNLIVSVVEDDSFKPLVLSSAIILEGESSEQQCAAVTETIQRGGIRLHRWAQKMEKMYPTIIHDIPPASAMNIGKLGYNGAVTSDTCNSARKTRRLLVDQIKMQRWY